MTLDLALAEPVTCPLLGLTDDPRTSFMFATPSHRCYAGSKPSLIDLGHQGTFCLTAAYPECSRFRPTHGSKPPRRHRVASVIVWILVLLAVFGVIGYAGRGIVVAALQGVGQGGGPVSPASSLMTATPGASAATAATGAAPTPSTVPTPTPKATTSPLPTSTAPTPRLHVVVRGETLSGIAARYGVTVKAIQKANQIANTNLIRVGDRLVIPPPA